MVIRDLLTDMFRARGPNYNFLFSGAEVIQHLYAFASTAFKSGTAHTVILCMDQNALVPPEKGAEQARRDATRKQEDKPYPDESEFCAAGIREGMHESKMNIKRVMANRKLRSKLWVYFVGAMCARRFVPPGGCTLIVDHCLEGSYVFRHDDWGLTAGNQLGEADLKVPYWVIRYSGTPNHIVVHSIDSDFLPILMGVVSVLGPRMKCRLSLRYWQSYWCDVRGAHDFLVKTHALNMRQWITSCIMCGSDYVEKLRVFNGIGFKTLFKLFEDSTDLVDVLQTDTTAFHSLVSRVHSEKKPKGIAPSGATVQEVGEAVAFNMRYWFRDWLDRHTFPRTMLNWGDDIVPSHVLRSLDQDSKAAPAYSSDDDDDDDVKASGVNTVDTLPDQKDVSMSDSVRAAIADHGKRRALNELASHDDMAYTQKKSKLFRVSCLGFIENE